MQDESIRPIFTDVDRSAAPQHAVDLLDAQHASDFILMMEQRALEALDISEGHKVLDAGCGTGKLTLDSAYLEKAIQEDRFLCTQTSVITAATKPL